MTKKNSRKSPQPKSRKQLNQALQRMLDAHALQLSEHVDSVQIIATVLMPDGRTARLHAGSGNAYARLLSVEKWFYMADSRIE